MASSMWRRSASNRFGDDLVLGHDRVEVGRLVADHAHVGEGLAHLRAPEADVFQGRHDPREQQTNGTVFWLSLCFTYSMHSSAS